MSRKRAAGVTRNEILDVAWSLIAERGADTSIQQIADAVGVSRQSVYLHFKTRGGLLMALVRCADERFSIREDFFDAMRLEDPRLRLGKCLGIWFDFAERIHPVATDLVRLRKTDPDAAAAWEDRMTDLRDWERQLVQSLQRDTVLRPDWSVEEATDFLWTSSSIQVWDLLTRERNWKTERAADVLARTIADALLV